jgi:hypothetical protein
VIQVEAVTQGDYFPLAWRQLFQQSLKPSKLLALLCLVVGPLWRDERLGRI